MEKQIMVCSTGGLSEMVVLCNADRNTDIVHHDSSRFSLKMKIAYFSLIAVSWGLSVGVSIYYAVVPPGSTHVSPFGTKITFIRPPSLWIVS